MNYGSWGKHVKETRFLSYIKGGAETDTVHVIHILHSLSHNQSVVRKKYINIFCRKCDFLSFL